jgi:glycosyltransferase involved in cell wall biosynthesis
VAVRVKAAVEKLVYSRAKLFIVLSQAFADVLRDRYGVNESQIRIVPGGVDADRFRGAMSKQEARRNLGWPQDRPVLLSVRRLYQRMGLENLIDAFQVAHRTAPDALLYIAGKGPLAASLQARIDASGLGQSVRLLGYLSEEELPLAYCAANVSVVPTLALEGFGLITVESLASGTPVLVTPVGGLPEVVGNLSPDLILPDTSAATMAERLTMFLRGGLALPDAETCRRYAREQFDWSVIAQRTKQVYEEALYG